MNNATRHLIDVYYKDFPYVDTMEAKMIDKISANVDAFRSYEERIDSGKEVNQSVMTYFGEEMSLDDAKRRYPNSTIVVMNARKYGVNRVVRMRSGLWDIPREGDIVIRVV